MHLNAYLLVRCGCFSVQLKAGRNGTEKMQMPLKIYFYCALSIVKYDLIDGRAISNTKCSLCNAKGQQHCCKLAKQKCERRLRWADPNRKFLRIQDDLMAHNFTQTTLLFSDSCVKLPLLDVSYGKSSIINSRIGSCCFFFYCTIIWRHKFRANDFSLITNMWARSKFE